MHVHPRSARRVVAAVTVVLGLVAVPLGTAAAAVAQPVAPEQAPAPTQLADPGDGSLGLSAPFGSFAPVPGRPADPPIGVSFESLSRAGGNPIKIDGRDVANTSAENYAIAVIDRSTRAVVESGTVNRGASTTLGAIAGNYSGQNKYLMVISSFRGIIADAGNTAAFQDAVRKLGGRDLTADELARVRGGAAFSVVGVPGGAAGGAYLSIDRGSGTGPQGDVNGYLRLNIATDQYGVVNTESPTFDTTNTSTVPGSTRFRFDRQSYEPSFTRKLRENESGFLLATFDENLRNETLEAYGTNNATNPDTGQPTGDAEAQRTFARALDTAARGTTIVVVRSIGKPRPVSDGWSQAATVIERLGGNRLAFNNLGADGEYSLLGTVAAGAPAVESSAALGNAGPVSGSLVRNRDMVFTPVAGAGAGGVNTQLIDIATQGPQAFPAFTQDKPGTTAAGTAAADDFLGRALRVCTDGQPCSVRTAFYQNYRADWHQVATDLESTRLRTYPGDGRGFSAADYEAVRATLSAEVSMVNRVRTYFTELQKPFGEAAQPGQIDTDALTSAVVDSIGAPKGSATTSYAFAVLGKLASLGSFFPATKAVSSGVSAALALGAFLTQPTGPPQLATTVQTTAAELGRTVRAQLLAASRSLNGTAQLVVSDFGRLKAVDDRLSSEAWRLPPDTGPALAAMSLAVKQSAAEKLVPLVYPWLLRGTNGRTAQTMTCAFSNGRGQFSQLAKWKDQPQNGAFVAPVDYISSADAKPVPAPYWFAKRGLSDRITPPASLTTMLFAPADAERGTLGMNLYSFLTARVFGTVRQADHRAKTCNLPINGLTATGAPVAAAVGVPTLLSTTVSAETPDVRVTFTEGGAALPGCADRPALGDVARCVTTFTTPGPHVVTATPSDPGLAVETVTVEVSAEPTLLQRVFGQLLAFLAGYRLFGL